MKKVIEFFRVLTQLKYLIPLMRYKWPDPESNASLAHMFEEAVDEYSSRPFIYFDDEIWTYERTNKAANTLAKYLVSRGVKHSDRVVLFMQNRPDYIVTLLALNKIGAIGVLINSSLTGDPLIHCVNSSESSLCIVGAELAPAIEEVLNELNVKGNDKFLWVSDGDSYTKPDWCINLRSAIDISDDANLEETNNVKAKDTAFYIFTSGTTGVPKAAIFPNVKIVAASTNISTGGYRMDHTDCMYNCLPLYHSTGLMLGLCACVRVGASTLIKRKFSASSFWREASEFNTTLFVYVGELCRYLANQEPNEFEENNPIRAMVGNGLRPDLWDAFRNRFNVEMICEIYGASEGNALFMNLLNKEKTIGMTNVDVELIKYDVAEDSIFKDSNNKYQKVEFGKPGLLINKISDNSIFNGYTDSKESEKKVLRNVFEEGDAWFNTGDLIQEIDVGYALGRRHFQFVDRIGDTFRWKSENVSTNEVAEILNGHSSISMANVYGVKVPNAEGRAGMAAFTLDDNESINWADLSDFVNKNLPKYARPVFIRIISEVDTTGTFKLKKNELREEGYDINKHGDEIYFMMPNTDQYKKLDHEWNDRINSGQAGY